jgi:hypothetical protein
MAMRMSAELSTDWTRFSANLSSRGLILQAGSLHTYGSHSSVMRWMDGLYTIAKKGSGSIARLEYTVNRTY